MIKRKLENTILESLQNFPVVGILGARQVGKTTLAKIIQKKHPESLYLDLELPSTLVQLQEPELYLKQHVDRLVILDEIQRLPDLFPILRSLVDQHRKPGRFLILGSSSPLLIRKASETLAGRIVYHELSPLLIEEVQQFPDAFQRLWLRGGFPESFLAKSEALSFQWLESFITTFLERDIALNGFRVPPLRIHRFWTMLAHYHGQLWNASQIANSLDVSSPSVKNYLEILHQTFIVRPLLPFFTNIKKRLVKSPKVYLRDSGILHALLNISSFDQLQMHPMLSSSFEGFVIEQILNIQPTRFEAFFYRTAAGAEIDLIFVNVNECMLAIKIKYSLSPKISKGFRSALNDLNCKTGFIIYPGQEMFPLEKNIYAYPAAKISQFFKTVEKMQSK